MSVVELMVLAALTLCITSHHSNAIALSVVERKQIHRDRASCASTRGRQEGIGTRSGSSSRVGAVKLAFQ